MNDYGPGNPWDAPGMKMSDFFPAKEEIMYPSPDVISAVWREYRKAAKKYYAEFCMESAKAMLEFKAFLLKYSDVPDEDAFEQMEADIIRNER